MNEAEILDAADDNMWQVFEKLSAAVPGGARSDDGDLVRLSSGSPIGFFNPTFPKGPVDAEAAVARTAEWYGEIGLPYVMLFRNEVAPGLADACAAAGMVEHWQMPLMVLDPIPEVDPSIDGLEIVPVTTDELDAYMAWPSSNRTAGGAWARRSPRQPPRSEPPPAPPGRSCRPRRWASRCISAWATRRPPGTGSSSRLPRLPDPARPPAPENAPTLDPR